MLANWCGFNGIYDGTDTTGIIYRSDYYIINIYYSSFHLWYRCEMLKGVPVQQWGIARRIPKPYGSLQTRYFKNYAKRHGVKTSDTLYVVPMDQCQHNDASN